MYVVIEICENKRSIRRLKQFEAVFLLNYLIFRYFSLQFHNIMDSEYLKKHVGEALTNGLAEVVLKRPVDPIEYLAFWLRKFVVNRDFDTNVSFLLNFII